jgi:PKD repeat protein
MTAGSGLTGGAIQVGSASTSGAFEADVTIEGSAQSNFDSQLAVAKSGSVAEFDAKVCVEIEATQVAPSALIITPTAANSSGLSPFTATYSASGWASGSKTITNYTWFFNNMNTVVSGGQNVEYTYTGSGAFTVVLRVTDSDGFFGYHSRRILTYSGIALDLPELQISGVLDSVNAPVSVDFGASGGAFGGGTILDYSWSFGHGLYSKRQNPSGIVYQTPGWYIPICTIVDDRSVFMSDDLDLGVNS